jgi:putative tryptophan/tyrosine transport system substrate-binding protein
VIKRREFITLLGGAAAWPLAAGAQQPALPVIGLLATGSPEASADFLRAFREGLKQSGHVEGENVAIEYRWVEQIERVPALAADLVRRQVAVMVTAGHDPAFAARRQPRPSRSCSSPPTTRSGWGWSPAWPGLAATRPASIFSWLS